MTMQHSRFRSGSFIVILALAGAMTLSLAGCAGMETESGSRSAGPLEKTYWRLAEVEGMSVPVAAGRREPNLQFDPEKKRVTGYSGVNIFSGGYDTTGGGLRMTQMASTRRAGPPELMKLETALLKALSATRSYRVSGDKLELIDSGGRTVARFEGQASR
jgi:heat shock protein HslJ